MKTDCIPKMCLEPTVLPALAVSCSGGGMMLWVGGTLPSQGERGEGKGWVVPASKEAFTRFYKMRKRTSQ